MVRKQANETLAKSGQDARGETTAGSGQRPHAPLQVEEGTPNS